ncbi:c-type cytochrome [Yersinia massiliensis]|uniref:c-type cytochrome n=1 Tax=Yersinia massiliensis TaxID=419257 RepID=UPI001643E212|nr:c-type cytochrome [Yersinia massiliensis]
MSKKMLRSTVVCFLVATCYAFPATALDGYDKFVANCSGCHGENAEGIEGMAPPLYNPELWAKLGDKRNDYIAGVITGGLSGTLNNSDNRFDGMVMPPQDFIDTADLVAITHYILNELNHVTGGPDAALFDKLKSAPHSHKDLQKLRNGD